MSVPRAAARLGVLLALVTCAPTPTSATEGAAPSTPPAEQPVARPTTLIELDHIRRVRITSLGAIAEDPVAPPRLAAPAQAAATLNPAQGANGPNGDGCSQIATWTNASFEGGQYVVQAGFAEDEMAAASFTLPAAAFPIQINALEMIFATSGATQPTTTEWSVLVWDGTPTSGTLVAAYSSDGKLLPHIQIPPGTNGVNVFFQIDPADPEQIIITNASGSNTFTFAYRIDVHNQQTQNPCFVGPPTCCNAFPVTDVGGLASSANNWLFGVNCGSFGCPPNGGWARFSQLQTFCRPTGDWVMRATYTPLSCQPGVGACCLPDGTCEQNTLGGCSAAGGIFQGEGSLCGQVTCPQPTGACCFASTGGCINLTQGNCALAGGVWRGPGSACGTIVCFPQGACCLPDGSCTGPVSPEACAALNGVFQGDQTNCAGVQCPQPRGACCFGTGFCLELTEAECAQGGVWQGPGTTCIDANGNGIADSCEVPPCPTDWNNDGVVNSTDVSFYFNDWFLDQINGTTVADFDENGLTNSTDVVQFLNAWFVSQGGC